MNKSRLVKFRVQNFKSITDSDWIEVGESSCLVGTNEAGKTNLLLALWKLHPANDEPIVPLNDYPRKIYVDYEGTSGEEIFITAVFELAIESRRKLAETFGLDEKIFELVEISRRYNKSYEFQLLLDDSYEFNETEEIEAFLREVPKFVYYSDYGNLDSEIYLPHVIENFKRTDLGEKDRAKARSLKVLFDFVSLKPEEILELGREQFHNPNQGRPNETQISIEREKKKKREILLQSASTKLTHKFKEWWKQGDYRFRFQADGNHFRIWVSDDIRTEEIELEGRSRGLQWFFSFFLVFLVESKDTHSNCILLLDEPGITLHPTAQFDLIKFFASLSKENQIIYTTHSPFLVNPDSLADVRAVYVDTNGASMVSADLRKNDKVAEKSIYPVHAAIGLTVSDTLLLGCQPILVEGPSDQIYLQLIKNTLLSQGKYKNNKEMVFIPTGGIKGMSVVINIVTGRENALPFVILDGDKIGKDKSTSLKKDIYKNDASKVLLISEIVGKDDSEVEDLFPSDELAKVFSKKYRGTVTDDFEYLVDSSKPIINQMEEYAKQNSHNLELGWKVELAADFQRIYQRIMDKIPDETVKNWKKLFDKITK